MENLALAPPKLLLSPALKRPSFPLFHFPRRTRDSRTKGKFFVSALSNGNGDGVSRRISRSTMENLEREGFASISTSSSGETSSVGVSPQYSLPPPPSNIGSPLFWIGVGVGLSALFSWVAANLKKYAMQQAFKTIMGTMPPQNEQYNNAAFSTGSPFPFPAPPASTPSAAPPPVASQKTVTVDVLATKVEAEPAAGTEVEQEIKKEPKKYDVSPEEMMKKSPFETSKETGPSKDINLAEDASQNGAASKQDSSASDYGSQFTGKPNTVLSVEALEKMMEDPTVQKMVYPYLPEEMRNPTTFKWMLQNPQYRHLDMASTPIKEDEEENFGSAMRIAAATILPMVVKASIELNLFEIIARAGPSAFLSPSEIASQLGTQNPEAPVVLDRILRFLTSQSLLKCTLATQHGGDAHRRYGLGPVARFFTPDQDGVSVAPLHLLLQDKVFMDSWYHLKDAVLEGGIAFNRAHGMNAFEYPKIDSRFNSVFNKAMSDQATIIIKKVLRVYKGFEGLKELLDVGGGVGTALQIITSHYPQIKGINFDMPHVLAEAPSYPGVEHVSGDMFVSIPKCEAIFMKWILHDWSDDHCLKLLKNCFEALPASGKVIIVESIVPENPEDYPDNGVFIDDVLMLTQNPGGKERTEEEFKALAKSSGFATCEIVCGANEYWVLEFHK